jgi:hypothetical protein
MAGVSNIHNHRETDHDHGHTGDVTIRHSAALTCKQMVAEGPQHCFAASYQLRSTVSICCNPIRSPDPMQLHSHDARPVCIHVPT